MSGEVVVIGGGVIGAACAYYLQKKGRSVTILDADLFGAGCSHANCGLVAPGHVLPLSAPGAVMKTMKAMCRRGSPFYVKPRFDPALWGWLAKFTKRCNLRDMLAAGHGRQALLDSSMALYPQILADESIDCEWEERGCLFVYQTKKAMQEYADTDRLMTEHFGISATRYDGDAVSQLEPALRDGLAGGWHYEHDAHLRSDRLMSEWRRVLEASGVVIREKSRVDGFDIEGGKVRAVHIGQDRIEAETFVLATGAVAPKLAKQLGVGLAIQPGKGYSITTPRPSVCPVIPMIFQEHKVVATPMRSGYRLGSTMEFSGYDRSIHPGRLGLLEKGAELYLTEPMGSPVQEQWYGWRPMSHDGLPSIGPVPLFSNTFIAAGHSMLGLSMAPSTGKLIAELVEGAPTHIDPKPYDPAR